MEAVQEGVVYYIPHSKEYPSFKAAFLLNDFTGLLHKHKIREEYWGAVIDGTELDIIILAIWTDTIPRELGRFIIDEILEAQDAK